ncbi:Ketosteroid isomerase-like protein [Alloactinosynnema sp. L-07]|nr:Ketosteroid isomerase-like protein [Alloactinosynnema sp. L-07]
MSEVDDFLDEMLSKQVAAERAIHEGDVEPRLAIWSRNDPVTLFGAAVPVRSGWPEVSRTFHWVASRFSESVDYRFEVVAAGASGDLAYTIGFEHNTVRVNGEMTTYTLRATHVYRREDGEWRIVHRHGDPVPEDQEPRVNP